MCARGDCLIQQLGFLTAGYFDRAGFTVVLSAEQAIQSLIQVANLLFEPYLTFQVDHWGDKRLGSIVDRNVVITALQKSSK